MADGDALTIHLVPAVNEGLAALARTANLPPAALAAEAVTEFVARQTATLAGIQRGLDDLAAGRLIDHDAAMDELDAEIERAARHARWAAVSGGRRVRSRT